MAVAISPLVNKMTHWDSEHRQQYYQSFETLLAFCTLMPAEGLTNCRLSPLRRRWWTEGKKGQLISLSPTLDTGATCSHIRGFHLK